MVTVALYARVSSEKQVQTNTIDSQIVALESRIREDGFTLLKEFKFIDNGYSGSNIIRPGLEKLRDSVSGGEVDKIYIHSPDRLSRKYAYQMILMEEFQNSGIEVIFLNCQSNDSPESHLLLQMQGMIAEYEREKIVERNRRGKIHSAKKGVINILSGAPYGYRYIDKHSGGGQAQYEINEIEAGVIRKIFYWVGIQRVSMGQVCRNLENMNILTSKGNTRWDRSVIWGMLRNPAYKGMAAFGKTKAGNKLPTIRPHQNRSEHSKRNYSLYKVEEKNWIYVPVPAIIEDAIFEAVQEQLVENRKIARTQQRGATHLLQGLLVCKRCHYAFCGKSASKSRKNGTTAICIYYRCLGTDGRRFGGTKICDNKAIRTDVLDLVVWEEVKALLNEPDRILTEYQRRISELEKGPEDQTAEALEKQGNKLKRGISRLIDSYAQEYISKEDFEPKVKIMKQNLKTIEEHKKNAIDQQKLTRELTLVITNLEAFSTNIQSNLSDLDWTRKRDIIRMLIKRIEINHDEVNIVYRIRGLANPQGGGNSLGGEAKSLQHCCRSRGPS